MNNIKESNPIYSFTAKELLTARDGDFIHHDKYTSELDEPTLDYAYCNTLKFTIKSSHYGEKVKGGTNATKYKVFVLFEDFYTIGKDKDIDFNDAIDYAIGFGDIHIRCNCPAQQFWGYNYQATQLKYIYGVPKEDRFPIIRNPNLKGTVCKHCDKVLQWVLSHKNIVAKMFALYYNRLNDGQSIYAVNTNGTTITIGKKNEDGDIFFERQLEETEEMKPEETEETKQEEQTTENTEPGVFDVDDWMEEEDNVSEVE